MDTTTTIIEFCSCHIPYNCLSNSYLCELKINNKTYNSVDHYYYSMLFTQRPDIQQKIIECRTFRDIYLLAKKHYHDMDYCWYTRRIQIMSVALSAKFARSKFADVLLNTGTSKLVHVHTPDSYWGTGKTGQGFNRLGELLVKIRTDIRNRRIAESNYDELFAIPEAE